MKGVATQSLQINLSKSIVGLKIVGVVANIPD